MPSPADRAISARSGWLLAELGRASAREGALARASALLAGATILATGVAGALWLFGDGRWISLPPLLPAIAVATVVCVAACVSLLAGALLRRYMRPSALARAIEQERGLRRGAVSGLLEIAPANPIAERAASRIEFRLSDRRLAPTRTRQELWASALLAMIFVVGVAAAAIAASTHRDAVGVLRHPLRAARGDLLPRVHFAEAATAIPRGTALTLVVIAPGRSAVSLKSREAGTSWRATEHAVSSGEARIGMGPLRQSATFVVSDARGSADTLVVRAVDRPFIGSLALEAVYPAALRRQPEPLPSAGPLLLPEGTTIRIRGRSSVPLAAAALAGPTGATPLAVAHAAFTGSHTVSRGGAFEWRFTAASGDPVDPPPPLEIALVTDALPQVEIVAPRADTTVGGGEPVRLSVRAADDHELGPVRLRVSSGDSRREIALAIPPAGGIASIMLDVAAAAPGSRVTVEAVAAERGGAVNRMAASVRIIQIMSATEQRAAARAIADSATAMASGLAAGQQQAERRTSETSQARGERRDGSDAPAAGHALASRARTLVEEQRGLAARADSLAAATRALESRLARAGALDDGLAARLAEVRSLLQRALTPSLAARLRDAEQAAREDSEEPLRRALSDVAREQRRAREQLERIVQMLRRAAIEGSLETLRAEAMDLAQPARGATADDARRLESTIGGVLDRLAAENARAGVPPTRSARENAAVASAALAQRPRGPDASAALNRAGESLAEARGAQIAEWKQELAADIDAAVQELVQLAAAEESLARKTGGGSDWRAEHAALEEAAAAVASRISAAARTSTLVSSRSDGLVRSARDQVARVAAPAFPPRDRTQSASLMRAAGVSLSRAAASLVRDRERTNAARSASGFTELLEELQKLAGQQRGLNAAAEGLPLELLGADGSGARDRARMLARQQRAIARGLEELGETDGGARAQPLAAEANRLADAFERAAVDQGVLARQQRLYHRLLEGGRLLAGDTGEEEDRREAVTARPREFTADVERVIRATERRHSAPGWAELRSLSPVERQMVVEYFERLNATP